MVVDSERVEWITLTALVICVLTLFVATTAVFVGGIMEYRPVLEHAEKIFVIAFICAALIPILLIVVSVCMGWRSVKIWFYTAVCLIPSAPFFGFLCYASGLSCPL